MPAHFVAYAYIMAMAVPMWLLLRKPLTASLVAPEDFDRRRNAWFVIMTAAFMSHNYWIFTAITAGTIIYCLQREKNPLAFYFTIFTCIPLFEITLPGFGLVNYLFEMNYARVTALFLLLPVAFKQVRIDQHVTGTEKVIMGLVLSFAALMVLVAAPYETMANSMRIALDALLGVVLPVYVASRTLRNIRQMRDAMTMLALTLCLLGVFAVFETSRYWLLFESIRGPLGVSPVRFTVYVIREAEGGGGALRASATAGHPIALGFMTGIGLCMWGALRIAIRPYVLSMALLGGILIGFAAALSRGPWVGMGIGLIYMTIVGPGTIKRIGATIGACAVGLLGLMFTPYGQKIYKMLPFVGEAESESVDYRVRLVEVSMRVFWDNPLFGNYRAMVDPRMEEMRQGQGIIDMVNAYLGLALAYGIVGMLLFTIPFVMAIIAATLAARRVEDKHPSMGLTGRALAGATLGILITLATSSSWQYIPVTYWPVLGMTAAYIGVAYRWANAQTTSTARQVDAGARFVGQGAPRPSPAKPTPGLPGNLPRPGVARRLHRSR